MRKISKETATQSNGNGQTNTTLHVNAQQIYNMHIKSPFVENKKATPSTQTKVHDTSSICHTNHSHAQEVLQMPSPARQFASSGMLFPLSRQIQYEFQALPPSNLGHDLQAACNKSRVLTSINDYNPNEKSFTQQCYHPITFGRNRVQTTSRKYDAQILTGFVLHILQLIKTTNQQLHKILYMVQQQYKQIPITHSHTSLNINIKSEALRTPTKRPLQKSQRGAVEMPWKQLDSEKMHIQNHYQQKVNMQGILDYYT